AIRVDRQPAAAEYARRRVVAAGLVVQEHELGIRLDMLIELQVAKEPGRVPLIDALQIVSRGEVVAGIAGTQVSIRRNLNRSNRRRKQDSRRGVARALANHRREGSVAGEIVSI